MAVATKVISAEKERNAVMNEIIFKHPPTHTHTNPNTQNTSFILVEILLLETQHQFKYPRLQLA